MSSLDKMPWFVLARGSACRNWAALLGGWPWHGSVHRPVGLGHPRLSHRLIVRDWKWCGSAPCDAGASLIDPEVLGSCSFCLFFGFGCCFPTLR